MADYSVEVQQDTQTATAETNRRREPRTSTKLTCAVVREAGLFKSKQGRPVRVLDISPGGLGFESPCEYQQGQKVHLIIDTPVKIGIEAVGEIRYCVPWSSSYRIGVQFKQIDPADRKLLHRKTFLELLRKKGGRTP
jgi:c-di-GMP-binding flagellar brake protein YcgR